MTGTVRLDPNATTISSHISWSPDGSEIAYARGVRIFRIAPVSGAKPVQVTNGSGGLSLWYDSSPEWSPDGTQLVFSRTDGSDEENPVTIRFLVSADGSGEHEDDPYSWDLRQDLSWSPSGGSFIGVCHEVIGICTTQVDPSGRVYPWPIISFGGSFPKSVASPAWQPLPA